ncbi:MAG: PxKF domain-containing protein [Vicinamibacterales bacterium]
MRIPSRTRALLGAVFTLVTILAAPAPSAAQSTYLVDTGEGAAGSVFPQVSLFASGSTNCSPQPSCAAAFNFLGAQFTLTEAAAIESIEAWVRPTFGGAMDVHIREDFNGRPSTLAPPLFSPNSIYSKRYSNLPGFSQNAGWLEFPQFEAVLAPGTYWVTLEPVANSGLSYTMPMHAPNPLAAYAYYTNGNVGYLPLTATPTVDNRLGIRIKGTRFPGIAFGTATRTMMKGSAGPGGNYDKDYILSGTRAFAWRGLGGPGLTSSYIFVIPGGDVHARGTLFPNGLSAGAYGFMSDCIVMPCSVSATGAARGIAFRTLQNMSNVPKTFQVKAILEGALRNAGRHAFGAVYAFDSTQFTDTIANSGLTPQDFLLSRDDFAAIAAGTSLSLATLFPPSALLAVDTELVTGPNDQLLNVPLSTGLITLNPQSSITLLFDVAVYAPDGGAVAFGDTLKPAPDFITDANGNPVPEIVAVGPSEPPAFVPASVSLSPASASTGVGLPHAVIASVTDAGGSPVPDSDVTFTVSSGPNAGLTAIVHTDTDGEAVLNYSGTALGTDTIGATVGTLTATSVSNTWTAGVLDRLAISPTSSSIASGATQTYTLTGFDAFDNSLGDVTSTATFAIAPDGSCTGSTCTATTPGVHTVTATAGVRTVQASLTITASGGFIFTGFFSPVNSAPTLNETNAGRAVPVKFSLGGDRGLAVFAPGFPASQAIACDLSAPIDTLEETITAGGSGLSYDPSTDRYTYVWKTEKAWANSCRQLTVRFTDGTTQKANFRFRK